MNIYNPLKPEEDIKKIYSWKLINDVNENIIQNQNKFSDYEIINHYRLNNSITDFVWLRKLKE